MFSTLHEMFFSRDINSVCLRAWVLACVGACVHAFVLQMSEACILLSYTWAVQIPYCDT